MKRPYSFSHPRFATLALLFFLTSTVVGYAVAVIPAAAQSVRPDLQLISASARITQDVVTCTGPPMSVTAVSCFSSSAPTDSYDISATFRMPPGSDFLSDIAENGLGIAIVGVTCASIAANGLPAGAFSVSLPALKVNTNRSGTNADFQGTLFVPGGIFFPDPGSQLAHLNLHLAAGLQTRTAFLHLDGNANLCSPTPLALMLSFTDSASNPDLDSICVDIGSPIVDTFNVNSYVIHGCLLSAGS